MGKLIIKDGMFCINADGTFVTDDDDAPCVCGGGPGENCPAPCVFVIISDLQHRLGDTTDPCYLSGGLVGQSASGMNGVFRLTFSGSANNHDEYHGVFPVSWTAIQAEGGVNQYTTWDGFELHITAQVGPCVNGLISDYWYVSSDVSAIPTPWGGVPDPPSSTLGFGVFLANTNGGPVNTGVVSPNFFDQNACGPNGISYGGVATVIQPPACIDPPIYYFAFPCDGVGDPIVIDLHTLPPEGATTCLYQSKRYRPSDQWVDDQTPVAVQWTSDPCEEPPEPGQSKIAKMCLSPSIEIAYDSSLKPSGYRGCVYGGREYVLTDTDTNLQSVGVRFTRSACVAGHDDSGRPTTKDGAPQFATEPPPDDLGLSIMQWGSILKRAIRLLGLNNLVPANCAGCARREMILNEFGEKIGRAIIKRLKL